MKDEELLQCPLLHGLDAMHRAEMMSLLGVGDLRDRLERCLTEHSQAQKIEEPIALASEGSRPVEKENKNWNCGFPTWTRSPKE